MAARLAATTHVVDPETHQMTELPAGSEPPPHLAALVTNPACWEDGKLPAAAKKAAKEPESGESGTESAKDEDPDTKQAAKKTAAARPARGRKSADEGSS
jgi:hypothetical protein